VVALVIGAGAAALYALFLVFVWSLLRIAADDDKAHGRYE
jgi:hypothetical protein